MLNIVAVFVLHIKQMHMHLAISDGITTGT